MSTEHKRPLLAFVAVAVICGVLVAHAARSNAEDLFRQVGRPMAVVAGPVLAKVVSPGVTLAEAPAPVRPRPSADPADAGSPTAPRHHRAHARGGEHAGAPRHPTAGGSGKRSSGDHDRWGSGRSRGHDAWSGGSGREHHAWSGGDARHHRHHRWDRDGDDWRGHRWGDDDARGRHGDHRWRHGWGHRRGDHGSHRWGHHGRGRGHHDDHDRDWRD